ncbi:MAG TPA: mechanosensitive ion channel family protein [Methylococcaceae bacterium]|nr:mechanosensitive ion channel family protein [Methylococcaceae bacterium]
MTLLEKISRGDFINPATFLGALFYGIVFILIGWLGTRVIRFVADKLLKFQRGDHDLFDHTALTFVTQLLQIEFDLVLITLYAHLIPVLRSISTVLLAGVSIGPVVIAFAAQATLGNLVSGISLLLYRPFKLGDRLQIYIADKPVEIGDVERLTLGYTILKTTDNRRIVVPNSTIANQITINLTTKDS